MDFDRKQADYLGFFVSTKWTTDISGAAIIPRRDTQKAPLGLVLHALSGVSLECEGNFKDILEIYF